MIRAIHPQKLGMALAQIPARRRILSMPTAKEFTILMEDRPGTLGKICRPRRDLE
jgi:hypothetical protein